MAVVNAEVEVTNYSINFMQQKQQIDNAKGALDLLLTRPNKKVFGSYLNVDFVSPILIETWVETAAKNNVELIKQKSNSQINSYDIKISQSGYLPTLGLVGSYGWNLNKSPASAFFPGTNNTSYSVGVGASLSWNLFDGGRTLTRVKNAKLTFENQDLLEQESKLSFSRDLTNSIQNLKNAK